jgi:carboxypeptidase D
MFIITPWYHYHRMSRHHVRILLFAVVALIPVCSAFAAPVQRLGIVQVLRVELDGRDDLHRLVEGGYSIDQVTDRAATVYATEAEARRLTKQGFRFREIERQPGGPMYEGRGAEDLGAYHSYATMTTQLQGYAATYTNICRLYSIGQSEQGRELWVLKITDNPDVEEEEPEVRYISTMHGDEPVGTEMCLYFIDMLLTNYTSDARLSNLVDNTDISIMPLMNPDGLELRSRYNATGFDLNRSFPEGSPPTPYGNILYGPDMDTNGRPSEVRHVMGWSASNSVVLSANFHTGALVANYPYDNDNKGNVDSPTPDDDVFEYLAVLYSTNNPPMWANNSGAFVNGTVNGADWYVVSGGLQDWQYRYLGCNDITIELSNDFKPPGVALPLFWGMNSESMTLYLEAVHMGVKGTVTDYDTGEPVFASVQAQGIDQLVFSDADMGDYYRMLLPGTYGLTVTAPGYETNTVSSVVVSNEAPTAVDVAIRALVRPDNDSDGMPDGDDPDDDNDGMPDDWEIAYGLDSLSEDDADDDNDNDGSSNLSEYTAGTIPTDDTSVLRLTSAVKIGDGYVIQWSSTSNSEYDVRFSTNLMLGFASLSNGIPATPPDNIYTAPPPLSDTVYYQIVIDEE